MDQNLTFEAVNAHVEKYFTPEQQNAASGKGATSAVTVCSAYATVRPILQLIANFPLIPQKWRDAVTMLMGVLDTMCPQQQAS